MSGVRKKTETDSLLTEKSEKQTRKKSLKTVFLLTGLAFFMVGAAFLSVPLYDTFCRITGFDGKPKRLSHSSSRTLDKQILVRFDANHAKDLPWEFKPLQKTMRIRIGEQKLAYYKAINRSDKPVSGMASYNVAPFKTAPYFIKMECFCFQEQILQAGESIDMPVLFYIDPAYAKDKRVKNVTEITLSYTFYRFEKNNKEKKT